MTEGDRAHGQQLYRDLVRWHAEVRRRDRARLAERYALNLEAASRGGVFAATQVLATARVYCVLIMNIIEVHSFSLPPPPRSFPSPRRHRAWRHVYLTAMRYPSS